MNNHMVKEHYDDIMAPTTIPKSYFDAHGKDWPNQDINEQEWGQKTDQKRKATPVLNQPLNMLSQNSLSNISIKSDNYSIQSGNYTIQGGGINSRASKRRFYNKMKVAMSESSAYCGISQASFDDDYFKQMFYEYGQSVIKRYIIFIFYTCLTCMTCNKCQACLSCLTCISCILDILRTYI